MNSSPTTPNNADGAYFEGDEYHQEEDPLKLPPSEPSCFTQSDRMKIFEFDDGEDDSSDNQQVHVKAECVAKNTVVKSVAHATRHSLLGQGPVRRVRATTGSRGWSAASKRAKVSKDRVKPSVESEEPSEAQTSHKSRGMDLERIRSKLPCGANLLGNSKSAFERNSTKKSLQMLSGSPVLDSQERRDAETSVLGSKKLAVLESKRKKLNSRSGSATKQSKMVNSSHSPPVSSEKSSLPSPLVSATSKEAMSSRQDTSSSASSGTVADNTHSFEPSEAAATYSDSKLVTRRSGKTRAKVDSNSRQAEIGSKLKSVGKRGAFQSDWVDSDSGPRLEESNSTPVKADYSNRKQKKTDNTLPTSSSGSASSFNSVSPSKSRTHPQAVLRKSASIATKFSEPMEPEESPEDMLNEIDLLLDHEGRSEGPPSEPFADADVGVASHDPVDMLSLAVKDGLSERVSVGIGNEVGGVMGTLKESGEDRV